jgi:voltage-gated sodium channel
MGNKISWYMRWQNNFITLKNNRLFEFFVIGIIVFSALLIGIRTYDIPDIYIQILEILDTGVTIFFAIEISIRFLAEKNKADFFKSGWNIFDSLVVIISLIPIEDSEMVLLARLIRIFRVLRMVSVIPELRILLTSLLRALPQLGYVVMLMFIIFYIYAAVGSTLFSSINPVLWGDISISMLTLFRVMTFEDWTDVMYETMQVYAFSWMFYMSFIFLTTFAFLNMVIGIVVNVMEDENRKANAEMHKGEPTIVDLYEEIQALKHVLKTTKHPD